MSPLISLTTDYGLADEYVGVMKGVILAVAPQAQIVDLTHGIADQNVKQAAYIIYSAFRYFPPGTIHVLVVDPGVGGSRKIVLLAAHDQLFLAPDNGLLTLVLAASSASSAYQVSNKELFLDNISTTFHGRDIFAPVAAHLANGLPPTTVGTACDCLELAQLDISVPTIDWKRSTVTGCVVTIDKFGNIITDIDKQILVRIMAQAPQAQIRVVVGFHTIDGIKDFYEEVGLHEPLALIGSRGFLEIAVNQGHAGVRFKAHPGDTVCLLFKD